MRFPDLSLRSRVDLSADLRRPHPVEKAFPDVSPASNSLVTSTGASDRLPVRSFDRFVLPLASHRSALWGPSHSNRSRSAMKLQRVTGDVPARSEGKISTRSLERVNPILRVFGFRTSSAQCSPRKRRLYGMPQIALAKATSKLPHPFHWCLLLASRQTNDSLSPAKAEPLESSRIPSSLPKGMSGSIPAAHLLSFQIRASTSRSVQRTANEKSLIARYIAPVFTAGLMALVDRDDRPETCRLSLPFKRCTCSESFGFCLAFLDLLASFSEAPFIPTEPLTPRHRQGSVSPRPLSRSRPFLSATP